MTPILALNVADLPLFSLYQLLCEMYELLKNEFPTHGLEIVFVSRDHDETSFDNYFRTMPWLSIPWNVQRELLAQR